LDIDAGSAGDDAARVTLAELLVALAGFALAAAAALTVLESGQRAWAFGAARVEAQQSGRAALDRLAAEIRNAGYGGTAFDAVTVAGRETIVLQHDLDGDGRIGPTRERVTWRLAGSILRRDAGGGAQPVINGVSAFALTYFDGAGAPTTIPAAVRLVEIVLVTRPEYSVPGSTVATVWSTRARIRNR
jgi:type II secretory pathway component PulJ